MTTRDRLMLIGIVALAVLLGAWFTTVAPERQRAAKISAEVETARQQLASAESAADSAKNAQAQYSSAYASLVSLGQAVPASAETPGLIYTLDRATHSRDVGFTSITAGTSGTASSSSSCRRDGGRARHDVQPGAVHVRLQRQLRRSLQAVRPARRLHRANLLRSAARQRTAADDRQRQPCSQYEQRLRARPARVNPNRRD